MTQIQRITAFMQEHGAITPFDAFDMGITRLAACIHTMRNNGVPVVTDTVETVNRYGDKVRYASYRLAA